jgi:hypothetical protein
MTLGKIFGILILSSLAATGSTSAGDISKNLAKSKNLTNSQQMAKVKGDKVPPKGAGANRHGAQRQLASQNQAASREI